MIWGPKNAKLGFTFLKFYGSILLALVGACEEEPSSLLFISFVLLDLIPDPTSLMVCSL